VQPSCPVCPACLDFLPACHLKAKAIRSVILTFKIENLENGMDIYRELFQNISIEKNWDQKPTKS
jgi:hypothetical protein